jgi:hypothetical protein
VGGGLGERSAIDAMTKLARSDDRVVISLDDLDARPWR